MFTRVLAVGRRKVSRRRLAWTPLTPATFKLQNFDVLASVATCDASYIMQFLLRLMHVMLH